MLNCVAFNTRLELIGGSAGQKRFAIGAREHLEGHPEIRTLKGIRLSFRKKKRGEDDSVQPLIESLRECSGDGDEEPDSGEFQEWWAQCAASADFTGSDDSVMVIGESPGEGDDVEVVAVSAEAETAALRAKLREYEQRAARTPASAVSAAETNADAFMSPATVNPALVAVAPPSARAQCRTQLCRLTGSQPARWPLPGLHLSGHAAGCCSQCSVAPPFLLKFCVCRHTLTPK